MKREIVKAPVADLEVQTEKKEDLTIKTTKINTQKPKSKAGRPKKFKEEIIFKFLVGLTQTQKDLIEKRMEELETNSRIDYVRNLIAQDIKGF